MQKAREKDSAGHKTAVAPRDSAGAVPRDLFAVILAGGVGTRFWPLSRTRFPKQFLRLVGDTSLLQRTAERLLPLVGWERLLVVTHRKYAARVRAELPRLPRNHVLSEPAARNTLPALVLATAWIRARCPEAVTIAAPSDHLVRPAIAFRQTLRYAARLAREEGLLVTLGVVPTRVETGYGYIEVGARLHPRCRDQGMAFHVQRFREKPDRRTAARYLRSGNFLWNSGMFVWRVDRFWEAASECASEMTEKFGALLRKEGKSWQRHLASLYPSLPSVSVDQGVLEPLSKRREHRIAVVRAPFAWSDIGSWAEAGTLFPTDAHQNALRGRVVVIDSRGNVIWSPRRLAALVGVQDLIVVDTPDAVLVCAKEHAQALREVIRELEQRGWQRYL